MSDSFGEFLNLSSSVFAGDSGDIQNYRGQATAYSVSLASTLESISGQFVLTFDEYFYSFSSEVNSLQESLSNSTKQIEDFLADSAAAGNGGIVRCLGTTSENSKEATIIIQSMGTNATSCITRQTNVSMKGQSLMNFINEDVVLNARGAADKLCSCSVRGGKKDKVKNKRCISKVKGKIQFDYFWPWLCVFQITDFLVSTQEGADTKYLNDEFVTLKTTITESVETFKECSMNVTEAFNTRFELFQNTVNACLAVGRKSAFFLWEDQYVNFEARDADYNKNLINFQNWILVNFLQFFAHRQSVSSLNPLDDDIKELSMDVFDLQDKRILIFIWYMDLGVSAQVLAYMIGFAKLHCKE